VSYGVTENDDGHFAKYWEEDQWCDELNTCEWLTFNRGGLRCKAVGRLGPMRSRIRRLANEWVESSVKEYGDTKEKQ
jgi:hypothetical protein